MTGVQTCALPICERRSRPIAIRCRSIRPDAEQISRRPDLHPFRAAVSYTLHLVVVNGNFTKCRILNPKPDLNVRSKRGLTVARKSVRPLARLVGVQVIHRKARQPVDKSFCNRRKRNISPVSPRPAAARFVRELVLSRGGDFITVIKRLIGRR